MNFREWNVVAENPSSLPRPQDRGTNSNPRPQKPFKSSETIQKEIDVRQAQVDVAAKQLRVRDLEFQQPEVYKLVLAIFELYPAIRTHGHYSRIGTCIRAVRKATAEEERDEEQLEKAFRVAAEALEGAFQSMNRNSNARRQEWRKKRFNNQPNRDASGR